MTGEPPDRHIAAVGDLEAAEPWDLEVWMRDDQAADGDPKNWFRVGGERAGGLRWGWLLERAEDQGVPVVVYARPLTDLSGLAAPRSEICDAEFAVFEQAIRDGRGRPSP